MVQPRTVRNRLLAVIAVILIVAALQRSYPVTMPLVVAVFIIATAWPIKPWLERNCSRPAGGMGYERGLKRVLALKG